MSNAAPDPFDPSELHKLRLSQDFSQLSQVKPVRNSVVCRKPKKLEFIRVCPEEEHRFTASCFTDEDLSETYMVRPEAGRVLGRKAVQLGLADSESNGLVRVDRSAGRSARVDMLGAFTRSYIDSRTDLVWRTLNNYDQARTQLVEYFGEKKTLGSITVSDAEKWKRWMLAKPLAIATVTKHIIRAKTMFADAVNDRLIALSPVAMLRGGSDSNPERQRFIKHADSMLVLNACPDADWRLIFSLCRWGGFRCPSEVTDLTWECIDWEKGRIRIESHKTVLRYCPMFPEIRFALGESFDLANDGAVHCVTRYGRKNENLRTEFTRIVKRAGLLPWPRLFHNLRATRRTELQESFPDHVVNKWLGQSSKVAEKHYLQVTDDHWATAGNFGPPTGPPIANNQGGISSHHENQETSNLLGNDRSSMSTNTLTVPPQGLEPWTR